MEWKEICLEINNMSPQKLDYLLRKVSFLVGQDD